MSDAYTPITRSVRLQVPRGHRIYTTTRKVPTEFPIPDIGDSMADQLGAGSTLADNIIFDVNDDPTADGKKTVSFQHTALPSLPWTTFRYLEQPHSHKIYTTTILIPVDPVDFPIPSQGVLISSVSYLSGVAAALQTQTIVGVEYPEAYGGYRLTLQHMEVPSGEWEEYESIAYTFPAIYPSATNDVWIGGSRQRQRVVPARVVYEYTADPGPSGADWLAAPAIWDFSIVTSPMIGPFEVASVLQQSASEYYTGDDGTGGQIGDFLNSTFITQDTVNDAISISAPGDLAYSIDASIPSSTTYTGWITAQTELMASRTIHKWYEFYMRRTIWVRAQ